MQNNVAVAEWLWIVQQGTDQSGGHCV